MKGIVFNLLEQAVCEQHGAAAWDGMLDAARVPGAYTSLGNYADAEMMQLVAAASVALERPQAEVLRWFGRAAIPILATRYPAYFASHHSTRPFVRSVNTIIHPEVHMLYPGAHCPSFRFEDLPCGALMMDYASRRRLCALAEGFVEGAAGHYGEMVHVAHMRCMDRGDPTCRLRLSFVAA